MGDITCLGLHQQRKGKMTNNWQIIVLLVAIFTSQWLASRHNDQQIASLKELFEAKLETVRVEIADLKVRVKRIEDQLDQILKPTIRK
jgi:hypothetical protein